MSTFVFRDFLKKKMRILFKLIDANGNGSIDLDDYKLIAERFSKAYSLTEEEKNAIQDWIGNGMKMVVERGKARGIEMPLFVKNQRDIEAGERVTEEQFVEAFVEFAAFDKDAAEDILNEYTGIFFDVFDIDKNGVISPDEMRVGLECFGMQPEHAEELGVLMTESGLKKGISRKAYSDMWTNFILSEDKTNEYLKVCDPK